MNKIRSHKRTSWNISSHTDSANPLLMKAWV